MITLPLNFVAQLFPPNLTDGINAVKQCPCLSETSAHVYMSFVPLLKSKLLQLSQN